MTGIVCFPVEFALELEDTRDRFVCKVLIKESAEGLLFDDPAGLAPDAYISECSVPELVEEPPSSDGRDRR